MEQKKTLLKAKKEEKVKKEELIDQKSRWFKENQVKCVEDVTCQKECQEECYTQIYRLFEKKGSKLLKEKKEQIKITNIIRYPFTYAKVTLLQEKRSLKEQCQGSAYVKTSSPIKKSIQDYDVWSLSMEDTPIGFQSCTYQMGVDGADYLEECPVCNTRGEILCKDCEDGYQLCTECSGTGKTVCRECKGERKQECQSCNQDGEVTCVACNGAGKRLCNTCKGTALIPCKECLGKGYLLYDILAVQEYNVNERRYVMSTIAFEERFENFLEVSITNKDNVTRLGVCVYEGRIEEASIWTELFTDNYIKEFHILENVEQAIRKDTQEIEQGKQRLIRQKLEIFQKDLYEVTYQIGKATYRILLDHETKEYVVDKHPLQDIAEVTLEQMMEAYQKEMYSEVYHLGKELNVVSKDIPDEWKYVRLRKSILGDVSHVFCIAMLAGELIGVMGNMLHFYLTDQIFYQKAGFWLPILIGVFVLVPIRNLWGYLKISSKKALLLCGGMVGVILQLLIILIFGVF